MPRLSSLAAKSVRRVCVYRAGDRAALKAKGKDIVELEIGDSPFPSTPHAKRAGIQAIEENETGYCSSLGLPEFRAVAARFVSAEFGYSVTADNIVVGSGAKPFEQFFAEVVLDSGDGVLVFTPQFPTYVPNLERRGARCCARAFEGRKRLPALGRRCPAFSRHRSTTAGDHAQLAAQPDGGCGDP